MVKVGEKCPHCGEVVGYTPNYARKPLSDAVITHCFRCGKRLDQEDTSSYVLVVAPEEEWFVCAECYAKEEVS